MEYTNRTKTVASYIRDISKNKILFTHKIQRKQEQWSKIQESKFIETLLIGDISIPPIHVSKDDTGSWVIDGIQRLTTIYKYYTDGFKIKKGTPNIALDGVEYEIEKKRFSQLPDELQQQILDTEILLVTYTNATDKDIDRVFTSLNNGTPLTNDQKLRSKLSSDIISAIDYVLESNFFQYTNITNGQKKKGEDLTIILEATMLLSGYDFPNFSLKAVEQYTSHCNLDDIYTIRQNCDRLSTIITEKKKFLKKIHLPMIIASATEENIKKEKYRDKIQYFLANYENLEEYKKFCKSGTTKKENVLGRWNYFKEN